MKKIKFGLALQILAGLILGIIVGGFFYGNPAVEAYLKPIGDIFIRLIKMIVVPIVFSSLIVGIAGAGDIKQVGRLGGKTLLYFEVVTTIAIVLGLLIANVFHPGTGINMKELATSSIDAYVSTAENVAHHSFADTFINIVPTNIFDSLTRGDMLSIIFFSVMFGLGVAAVVKKGNLLYSLLKERLMQCFG